MTQRAKGTARIHPKQHSPSVTKNAVLNPTELATASGGMNSAKVRLKEERWVCEVDSLRSEGGIWVTAGSGSEFRVVVELGLVDPNLADAGLPVELGLFEQGLFEQGSLVPLPGRGFIVLHGGSELIEVMFQSDILRDRRGRQSWVAVARMLRWSEVEVRIELRCGQGIKESLVRGRGSRGCLPSPTLQLAQEEARPWKWSTGGQRESVTGKERRASGGTESSGRAFRRHQLLRVPSPRLGWL
jgi:hypothetical protein